MSDGELILIAGALMVAGLVASLAADRLRLPGLVLFLGLGMAIGSDGTGWIDFTDYELARTIGIVALALILFEGGLTTSFREIRSVAWPAFSLAFAGTLLTALVAGAAATWIFDLSLLEGLLLGSIVAATDGAAIFALLRNSNLDRRIGLTLEGESGFNDPLAVLLVIGLIDWIQKPGFAAPDMLLLLLRELGIGLAVGVAVGWLGVQAVRRARLGGEAAYPIATLSIAALAYGGAAALDGSGFLSVYLAGIALGSTPIPAARAVSIFHQGLAGLAEVTMFLVLGLLVFPSRLWGVAFEGTVLALVLMFLARPVATFVATVTAGFSLQERVVLAWAGLRGAVPVVLATFPVIAAVSHSFEYFNIVFFAVLFSTLLQGTTFEPLANRLGVTAEPGADSTTGSTLGRLRSTATISTSGPWDPADGHPAYPRQVNGVRVTSQLLTRLDEDGALVRLADGRYAFTGATASIGSARALQGIARRRLAGAKSDEDRAWWREIIGALARGSD
jgi:cell volume regulation protein A